jgi:GntR family transcriptional repressor for pyruvate dehydrogenase complex
VPKARAQIFEAVRSEKAPQRIIGQIRTAILEGKLKPGDRLPPEQELTLHFGVSRQTLREALRALEYLGLLEIRAGLGGGAFVSPVDMGVAKAGLANFLHFQNMSIGHLSEIRKALEPLSARLAATRMSPMDWIRIRTIQDQWRSALAGDRFDELVMLGISFHRSIAEATGNPVLILMLDFIENILTEVKRVLKPDMAFFQRVADQHDLILAAIEDKDPERAEHAMYDDVATVEEELMRLAQDHSEIRWS